MQAKHLLMVAFHFPPIRGSSGFQRTLAFAKYLGDFGWRTTVLTASKRVYGDTAPENEQLVPSEVTVMRTPAWDAARDFAISGRYPDVLALPDRWQSWIPGGILLGLARILRDRPTVLFSTFPIASAHVIALALHRLTGIPWVADFRDPMDQITYPENPRVRRTYRWIEERAFRYANRILVTTPGTAALYRERYGRLADAKLLLIPNGFDPESFPSDFAGAGSGPRSTSPAQAGKPLILLHSGQLYPSERDPRPFFRALSQLRSTDPAALKDVRVVFRATGHDQLYGPMLEEHQLTDLVILAPPIPYAQALRETLAADALLIFQAQNCDSQIPAKAYECLYTGRPILGITNHRGDTGQLLTAMGVESIAALEDQAAISQMLAIALPRLRAGDAATPVAERVALLSRQYRTAELADALERL